MTSRKKSLMHRSTRIAAAAMLVLAGSLAVTGCSSIDDAINRQQTNTYADKAAYASGSSVDAEWIPDDATDITVRTPADRSSGTAVILLTSPSALPSSCTEAERKSAPLLTIDGAPDIYDPSAQDAFVCADWTVMPSATGWFGWTPNTEDQAG